MIAGLAALLGLPGEAVTLFLALTVARPIGLVFGFVIFPWAMGQSFILRISIACALGLPMSIAMRSDIAALVQRQSLIEQVLLTPKEFALGFGIGFLASFPLVALQYAGAITDSFRGDSGSGHPDPAGGKIGAWGTYFLMIGMIIFTFGGGMRDLINVFYESYAIWPPTEFLPQLKMASVGMVWQMLDLTLKSAIIVAAPILCILMAVDFALALGARMAQRFQLMSLEMAVKNLVAALLLPVMAAYLVRYLAGSPIDFDQLSGAMQTILR
jgi:type III secretion protein T